MMNISSPMKGPIKYPALFALLALITSLSILPGCSRPVMKTKADKFPLMYEEKPLAIFVLPPMNETTAVDARIYHATTMLIPLSLQGYYVFPIEVTTEILKNEGLYNAELLVGVPLNKFHDHFGADAVLFTTIKEWDKHYAVVSSNLTVSVHFVLISTKTQRTLWEYTGRVVVDLSGGSSSGGLAGLISQVVVTAINTATTDYVPAATQANYFALTTIPVGKYNSAYGKDQGQQVVEQNPEAPNESGESNSGGKPDNEKKEMPEKSSQ